MRKLMLLVVLVPLAVSACSAGGANSSGPSRFHDDVCIEC
jgi:hypothetical protein